ncbi:MAG: (2Fe-2S)-binding protein [Polyangiaceae bacterium]|nr:(2Fe-2S)-binding protein [Polyangiaceae bacterium]
MIVCHCRRVSHHRILEVVREGAHTVQDVSAACGAGSGCGGCLPHVSELIAEAELAQEDDVPALHSERAAVATI